MSAWLATFSTGRPGPQRVTGSPILAFGAWRKSMLNMSIDTRPTSGTMLSLIKTGVPFFAWRG